MQGTERPSATPTAGGRALSRGDCKRPALPVRMAERGDAMSGAEANTS